MKLKKALKNLRKKNWLAYKYIAVSDDGYIWAFIYYPTYRFGRYFRWLGKCKRIGKYTGNKTTEYTLRKI